MSFRTIPIKIPNKTPSTNYIVSSSCPCDKISIMMKIMQLRDAPYEDKSLDETVSKSAPACILSEYMSVYMSDNESDNDDLVYSLDGSDIENEENHEIFDGDFTKDNPIVRKMFEDAAAYLIKQEEEIDLEIDHRNSSIV